MRSAVQHGASKTLFHIYRKEWEWLTAQHEHGRKIDRSVFKSKFPRFKVISTDSVLGALEEVKDSHARVQLNKAVEEAVDLINNGEAAEAVALVNSATSNIVYEIEHNADAADLFGDWNESLAEYSRRHQRVIERGQAGIPTGIPTLDSVTGGLQEGWLVTVGARLGVGKSWSLMSMAYGAVSQEYDAAYFSLEQSRHEVAMRIQSLAARNLGYDLNPADIGRGIGMTVEEYEELLAEIEDDTPGRMYVNDSGRGRVSIRAVEAAIEAKKPHIAFIDYITLLKTEGKGEWMDVAKLSSELKVAAEHYRVPIVAASQLNRSGVGKNPDTDNLSRSDSIGQDSDIVIMLTKSSTTVRHMRIVKNRHGPDDIGWYMRFDPSKGIYQEITGNEAESLMDKDQDED